jgi:hypothetical protein
VPSAASHVQLSLRKTAGSENVWRNAPARGANHVRRRRADLPFDRSLLCRLVPDYDVGSDASTPNAPPAEVTFHCSRVLLARVSRACTLRAALRTKPCRVARALRERALGILRLPWRGASHREISDALASTSGDGQEPRLGGAAKMPITYRAHAFAQVAICSRPRFHGVGDVPAFRSSWMAVLGDCSSGASSASDCISALSMYGNRCGRACSTGHAALRDCPGASGRAKVESVAVRSRQRSTVNGCRQRLPTRSE